MSSPLVDLNQQLLESGDFADVDIICQGRTWKAHRVILAGRSPWFKGALSGDWTEATTRKIHLDAVEPDLMDILMKYIYTDKFPKAIESPSTITKCLESTVQLFILADFFLLDPLRDSLLRRLRVDFCRSAMQHSSFELEKSEVDSLKADPIEISERSLPGLLEDLFNAVRLAYSIRTARELHKTVTILMLCMQAHIDSAAILEITNDLPDFHADLCKTLLALHFDYDFRCSMGAITTEDKAEAWFKDGDGDCNECKLPILRFKYSRIVVGPIPGLRGAWCKLCARDGYRGLIEDLIAFSPVI